MASGRDSRDEFSVTMRVKSLGQEEEPNTLEAKFVSLRVGPEFRLKHYEVIRALGEGGMGKVFLARDLRLGRLVALKFVLHSLEQGTEEFLKEARVTVQLNHEKIVTLYDVDELDGLPYMVLEHLAGETKRRMQNATSVERRRSARPMGLENARQTGVAHREDRRGPGNS